MLFKKWHILRRRQNRTGDTLNDLAALANRIAQSLATVASQLGIDPSGGWFWLQLALIAAFAVAGKLLQSAINRLAQLNDRTMGQPWPVRRLVRIFSNNIWLIFFTLACVGARQVLLDLTWPSRSYLLFVVWQLALAWLFINFAAAFIRNQVLYRLVAVAAWIVVALNILGIRKATERVLASVGVQLGEINVTPLLLIKTGVFLAVALWLVFTLVRFLEFRLNKTEGLTPSVRVLIGQLAKFVLVVVAIVVVLSSAGIDLSAFALFSGALGVGLGFGLQKIVANFTSGLILLMDKSIKPGDVISVGQSFGWVGAMGARYTSVQTREGKEYLIPNEDLITSQVVNWSFSNDRVRLETDFGVAYNSNPHHVIRVAIAAVKDVARVIEEPEPRCFLTGFGDSSLDFTLRFWIRDPSSGLGNLRGDVYLALWDAFKREGIEIPYPVRDVRLPDTINLASDKLQGGR